MAHHAYKKKVMKCNALLFQRTAENCVTITRTRDLWWFVFAVVRVSAARCLALWRSHDRIAHMLRRARGISLWYWYAAAPRPYARARSRACPFLRFASAFWGGLIWRDDFFFVVAQFLIFGILSE